MQPLDIKAERPHHRLERTGRPAVGVPRHPECTGPTAPPDRLGRRQQLLRRDVTWRRRSAESAIASASSNGRRLAQSMTVRTGAVTSVCRISAGSRLRQLTAQRCCSAVATLRPRGTAISGLGGCTLSL
jgi:hypothetical protein